jgi:hypothetical protein
MPMKAGFGSSDDLSVGLSLRRRGTSWAQKEPSTIGETDMDLKVEFNQREE